MKILLIDNYDSFTFNLFHYLSSLNVNVEVFINDKITSKEIIKKRYNKILKIYDKNQTKVRELLRLIINLLNK